MSTPLDPFEVMRALRPFNPSEQVTADGTDLAPASLFEEITMQSPSAHTAADHSRIGQAHRPLWRRPAIVAGAAAAALALVVASALTLNGERPNAYADMVAAGEATAAAASGRVMVAIDIRSDVRDGSTTTGFINFDTVFSGDDFSVTTSGEIQDSAAEENPIDPFGQLDYRFVDGAFYVRMGTEPLWRVMPSTGAAIDEGFPGLTADNGDPSTMMAILNTATGVIETSAGDGRTTYAGTVTAAAIEAIEADRLPAGIALIASSKGNLPPTIGLTVTVFDGRMETVRLDAVGEYPGDPSVDGAGTIDASITTRYLEMGIAQQITAPAPDQIASTTPEIDPEMMAARAVLSEFISQHPELCFDDVDDASETDVVDQIGECLEREGGTDVADAWRTVNAELPDDLQTTNTPVESD